MGRPGPRGVDLVTGAVVVSTTVRVRLFIAGKLCDEVDLELGAGQYEILGEIGTRHANMVSAAVSEGLDYMIEFTFPDGDHVRWGTDAGGMVTPLPVEDLSRSATSGSATAGTDAASSRWRRHLIEALSKRYPWGTPFFDHPPYGDSET